MIRFKDFIAESQWMYHGTTHAIDGHLKYNKDKKGPLDQALGAHFAADKSVSDKFAQGVHTHRDKPAENGHVYRTKSPPRSKLEVVDQTPYKHGGTPSDQASIGAHVAGTVFAKHKDMFKQWAMHARVIDDHTAEKLHDHLSRGKAPSDQKTFGTAASKGSNSFKSYMGNFDSTLMMEPHEGFRSKVISHFHDIMKSKGKVGMVYKNTSPMEAGHIPSDNPRYKDARKPGQKGSNKSYVIFNPEHHPLEKM